MKHRLIVFAVTLLLLAIALDLRVRNLSQRPMHADEAVNTFIFKNVYETSDFLYQRHDHHGPSLYYLTLPVVWLSGAADFNSTGESTYRAVSVVFSLLSIALLWLLRDALGKPALAMAALLLAISPAFVYYSRYYIHEPLLVFFALALIAAGWRYTVRPRMLWVLVAGSAAAMMLATKETSLILFASMFAGVAALLLIHRKNSRIVSLFPPRHLAIAALFAIIIPAMLFSALLRHPLAIIEPLLSYFDYAHRAEGAGHAQPWYFYLRMLSFTCKPAPGLPAVCWTEALILLLALLGSVSAITGRGLGNANVHFVRFLLVYTACATAIFSLIPYKTPWNALPFLQGMILLAGVGAVTLLTSFRPFALRTVLAIVLLAGVLHLGSQAQLATDKRYAASEAMPYAYAHTSPDIFNLIDMIDRVAEAGPDDEPPIIQVLYDDSWPLPWYLRRYEHVGVGSDQSIHPQAGIIVAKQKSSTDPDAVQSLAQLQTRLGSDWRGPQSFALRPRVFLAVYIRDDLFEAMIHP
jgi:uncharacterized protein (TIGR03663 family)